MAKSQNGIVGFYTDEHALVDACRKTREAGFKKFDAITPYPVHGIEEAIGIERSFIPWVTFIAGVSGGSFGLWFEYWSSAVSWPINVGGKPFFSWPAFIPVTFELTVLLGALMSVGALFYICGLPKVDPPILDPDLTSHKFAIFIPEDDNGFERSRAEQHLRNVGASNVRFVSDY